MSVQPTNLSITFRRVHGRTDVQSHTRQSALNALKKKPPMLCEVCNQNKDISAFSKSDYANKTDTTRTTRCKDCSNPPCVFQPRCKTCVICRDSACRNSGNKKPCTKPRKALPVKFLPTTTEDVLNFACKRCRYERCVVRQADGTICGEKRERNPDTARRHGLMTRKRAKVKKEDYKCRKCQTWMLSQRNLKGAPNPLS